MINNDKKGTKSPKKDGDLPPVLKETLRLLSINPTARFVIERTGKDKRNVDKAIKRLKDKGFITNISRGVYSVKKSPISKQGVTPSPHNPNYFRLHSLEIRANISNDDLRRLRNLIIKTTSYKNQPNGVYFRYLVSGLLTTKGLYLTFPGDWDIKADTKVDLINLAYDEIMKTLSKWEQKYKIGIFKDNKVNFEIVNMHIAIAKNGVVKEFKQAKISQFKVVDDYDGKTRFLMDFSKGLAELEAVHPNKAFDDSEEAKFFMNTLKDGHFRNVYTKTSDFFNTNEDVTIKDLLNLNKKLFDRVDEIQQQLMSSIEVNKQLSEIILNKFNSE
jgi:hypothetical protein